MLLQVVAWYLHVYICDLYGAWHGAEVDDDVDSGRSDLGRVNRNEERDSRCDSADATLTNEDTVRFAENELST